MLELTNEQREKEKAMLELTNEQREQVKNINGDFIAVVDPLTQQEYVLVRKAAYERIKTLLYDDGEYTEEQLRVMLARAAEANGWNGPQMAEYDDYDAHRAKRCS